MLTAYVSDKPYFDRYFYHELIVVREIVFLAGALSKQTLVPLRSSMSTARSSLEAGIKIDCESVRTRYCRVIALIVGRSNLDRQTMLYAVSCVNTGTPYTAK